MRAVVLESLRPIDQGPLVVRDVDQPTAGNGQVVVKVAACGVCRSNLHMVEGDWAEGGTPSHTPIIPGHEVVGTVTELGSNVEHLAVGDRVGVMPLWSTCGYCEFCVAGLDHLCQSKHITGETVDGGYAEYMLATAAHTSATSSSGTQTPRRWARASADLKRSSGSEIAVFIPQLYHGNTGGAIGLTRSCG